MPETTKIRKIERKQEPMSHTEIFRIVHEFVERLLDNGVAAKMGYMTIASLAAILEVRGVIVEIMITDMGEDTHYWLKLPDGRALDPIPPPYLGPPRTYHLLSEPKLATGEYFDPVTGELYEPADQ
jgi:hypothetical protein